MQHFNLATQQKLTLWSQLSKSNFARGGGKVKVKSLLRRVKSCKIVFSMSWCQRTDSKRLVFHVERVQVLQNIRQDMYVQKLDNRLQVVWFCCGERVKSIKIVVGLSWIYRTKLGLVYVRYLRKVKRGSILGELDLQNSLHVIRFYCGVTVWLILVKL